MIILAADVQQVPGSINYAITADIIIILRRHAKLHLPTRYTVLAKGISR